MNDLEKQEKEMLNYFRQVSSSGRVDILAHSKTILRAEEGIKKEYGLEDKPSDEEKKSA
jgi:hypothetical protein